MDSTPIFELETEYLLLLGQIANRFSVNDTLFSSNEFIQELHNILDCEAVVLVDVTRDSVIRDALFFPHEKESSLSWIFHNDSMIYCFSKIFSSSLFGGVSELISNSSFPYCEIDIIPLSRLAIGNNTCRMIILIKPRKLHPLAYKIEIRDSQRMTLAHLLSGLWERVTNSGFEFQDDFIYQTDIKFLENDIFHSSFLDRLHFANLSDLLEVGIRSSHFIREKGHSDNIYFFCESNNNVFNWEKWTPLFPLINHDDIALNDLRNNARKLVYWCRWFESHHDIEKEYYSHNLHGQNFDEFQTIKWVQNQRKYISEINIHLDQLRQLSSNFFTGFSFDNVHINGSLNSELHIQTKTLINYFFNQWLTNSNQIRKNLQNGFLTDIEFCRNLHGITTVSHYLYINNRVTDEVDLIHRLMQLISDFCHYELEIPSRIDLRAHLLHIARGEPALHSLKPYYRDHFLHSLQVSFLGHLLLETKIDNSHFLWQIVAKKLKIPVEKKKVLQLWYLAALLHDIGYTMDMLLSSRKHLGFFKHAQNINELNNNIDQSIKKLSSIGGISFSNNDNIGCDHGIVGAIHLDSLIQQISKEENIDIQFYNASIKAIALHNLRNHRYKLKFSEEPIAFILAICDQIQEWRRSQLPFSTAPNVLLTGFNKVGNDQNQNEGLKNVNVNISTSRHENGDLDLELNSDNKKLEFVLEYGDLINKNCNVFNIWLDATLNFQRLDFDSFPIDIFVTYKTPFYKNNQYRQSQLHRLRNAAHDTHMSYLQDWFPNIQSKSSNTHYSYNGAIIHTLSDDFHDILTIDLKKLSQKALITKDLETFRKSLKEWKCYNEDQDFLGDYVPIVPE